MWLTAGTVVDHTRVPLRDWLVICWLMTATKVGISATSLERLMGLDYKSAWSTLHKIRSVMDQVGRDRLTGEVEIDETYVGGKEVRGRAGRARGKKEVVIVACERKTPTAMGRIRLRRLPDASALSLRKFIEDCIEPGTVIVTDAWSPYAVAFDLLAADGVYYTHKAINLSDTDDEAHADFPHVHRIAALLKRWLLGTHQGGVESHHLDAYLVRVRVPIQPPPRRQPRRAVLASRLRADGPWPRHPIRPRQPETRRRRCRRSALRRVGEVRRRPSQGARASPVPAHEGEGCGGKVCWRDRRRRRAVLSAEVPSAEPHGMVAGSGSRIRRRR